MKKCVNGVIMEMTPEEIAEFESAKYEIPEPELTDEQKEIKHLKAQLEAEAEQQEFLESCLMEMAEIVYA